MCCVFAIFPLRSPYSISVEQEGVPMMIRPILCVLMLLSGIGGSAWAQEASPAGSVSAERAVVRPPETSTVVFVPYEKAHGPE
jgi:hypothetical protein